MPDDRTRLSHPEVLIAGGLVLALGLAMLLTPAEDLRLETGRLIGPFVMILIGTTILLGGRDCGARGPSEEAPGLRGRASRRERSTGGLWLIGIGCWLVISQTQLFGLGFRMSWPLLLIVIGLLLMTRGSR